MPDSPLTPPVAMAVLTGGKSSRMGTPKAFVTLGGDRFLDTIVGELQRFSPQTPVLISTTTPQPIAYEHYANTLPDETAGLGPMGGLYTCLKHTTQPYLFVCAVDMPFIKKELIDFMSTYLNSEHQAYVITTGDKTHPLCAIYHQSIIPVIEQMLGEANYRLMALLARIKTCYIPLQYTRFGERVVANINTPQELAQLHTPHVFCVSGLKNTGKTTLITKLVSALRQHQLRVGVIKHDGHDFDIDHPQTDTDLYRQAGSCGQIIYSATQYAVIRQQGDTDIHELIAHFADLDVIIIEGLKHATFPKIEVVGTQPPVCDPAYVKAYATDGDYTHDTIPTFSRNDIPSLLEVLCSPILTRLATASW